VLYPLSYEGGSARSRAYRCARAGGTDGESPAAADPPPTPGRGAFRGGRRRQARL